MARETQLPMFKEVSGSLLKASFLSLQGSAGWLPSPRHLGSFPFRHDAARGGTESRKVMVFLFLRAPKGTYEAHQASSKKIQKRLEAQYSTYPLGDV